MKRRIFEYTTHRDEGSFTVTLRITPPRPATYFDPPEPAFVEIEHIECSNPKIDLEEAIEILGGEKAVVREVLEYHGS